MIKNLFARLWLPVCCFAILVMAWLTIVEQFGDQHREANPELYLAVSYALQSSMWLVGAWIADRLIGVVVWRGLAAKSFKGSVPKLLLDVTTVCVLLVAVTGIVGCVFQYSVAGIWATSGVVGIVLGIALKDVILDVFTGLAVNIDRPFIIGDWVQIPDSGRGTVGQVQEINWRTTRLRTEDNLLVVIPNSVLSNMVITNFNQPTMPTRIEVLIEIESWISVERVRRVLLASMLECIRPDAVLANPAPSVLVHNTTNSGIQFRLLFWINPWAPLPLNRARDIVLSSAIRHLERASIPIAFPKTDITVKRVEVDLQDDSHEQRRRLLHGVSLFRDLPSTELGHVADQLQLREITAGEVVIRQGDPGESMFILGEGLLKVFVTSHESDERRLVATMCPGEFFGEMSLLTGEARLATVVAECAGRVYEIRKACLSDLFQRQPSFMDSISRVVAARKIQNDTALKMAVAEQPQRVDSFVKQLQERIRNFFRGIISG